MPFTTDDIERIEASRLAEQEAADARAAERFQAFCVLLLTAAFVVLVLWLLSRMP